MFTYVSIERSHFLPCVGGPGRWREGPRRWTLSGLLRREGPRRWTLPGLHRREGPGRWTLSGLLRREGPGRWTLQMVLRKEGRTPLGFSGERVLEGGPYRGF